MTTKASLYKWLGLHHREYASNLRRHLELTGHMRSHGASSSRPKHREDSYWLQGVGHNVRLATNRAVTAQTGNHCDFLKDESGRKSTSGYKNIYLDAHRARSDGMEIRGDRRWWVRTGLSSHTSKNKAILKLSPSQSLWTNKPSGFLTLFSFIFSNSYAV